MKKPTPSAALSAAIPKEKAELAAALGELQHPPSRASVVEALTGQVASMLDGDLMDVRDVLIARGLLVAARIVQAAPEAAFTS